MVSAEEEDGIQIGIYRKLSTFACEYKLIKLFVSQLVTSYLYSHLLHVIDTFLYFCMFYDLNSILCLLLVQES